MSRKRARSVLLVLSIGIAFFIYGLLASFEYGFNGGEVQTERLIVTNKVGNAQSLPISYYQKLEQMPETGAVTYMTRMRATYREPTNFLGANAVEPRSYAAFFKEQYAFTEEQLTAMEAQRDSLIVGRALAQREGWEIGQRIVLTATNAVKTDGSSDWGFQIVGIFDGATKSADTNFVIMRYDYFNAARTYDRDTVGNFGILPAEGVRAADVIKAVDARFANSANETRTRTESEFMKAFVAQFADITTIVRLIVGASFVTILMIVANTMFFAIRERTLEIGVLKVLGFSRGYILRTVLAETVWIFALGLGLGLLGAMGATSVLAAPLSTVVPSLALTPQIALNALGLATVFALLTGGVPAVNAMRIPSSAALKGV
ncbi:ABC transporter permease [Tropicibacter oceani]|uniref:ABC transporter permease n=1 Tax=Tropicibacter oceani TaxID=3058420 RepID=A0ABY8QIP4_9RHOB|nr:ABC transporter permease [Tropicibacter oceani]WGW04507.1 ABC transporter permease [Tropicibacter oceani]